jgi:hypothetical protein
MVLVLEKLIYPKVGKNKVMKKLNWALRLCKPAHIMHTNCYYEKGKSGRDWKLFIKLKEW